MSTPLARTPRAASSIEYVLPTPAEAPKKILSLPRRARASSALTVARIWSGSGRVSFIAPRIVRQAAGSVRAHSLAARRECRRCVRPSPARPARARRLNPCRGRVRRAEPGIPPPQGKYAGRGRSPRPSRDRRVQAPRCRDRRLADIAPEEIHLYLVKPDCFVWVALLEPEPRALELMQAEFDLHPLAVEDARHGHQRPKIEEYGDSLFV